MFKRARQENDTDQSVSETKRRSKPVWVAGLAFRLVRNLLALGMLAHIVLVCTPLADSLRGWLDITERVRNADVILCLGGRDRRVFWAAELYHRGYALQVTDAT